MKNLKPIEKLMMLNSRRTSSDLETAYNKVVTVFKFIDKKEHSNHCEILKQLYDVKKRKTTLLGISILVGVSDNALRRYRRNYVDWFRYYLDLERENAVS